MSKSMVAGGLAGAVVIVLAWVTKTFLHVDVPAEVAGAIGVLIQAFVHEKFPEQSTGASS